MDKLGLIGNSIFKVNTSSGSGSCFFLKSKNIAITNYHVVKGYKKVCIEDNEKNRFIAEVVIINIDNDVAFLKIDANLEIGDLQFGDSENLKSRDEVFVLGYPFGMPYIITKGIISSPKQLMNGKYYIQTDAAVNPGNSGGPIVNSNGEVVGMTTSKFVGNDTDNVGFAIPYLLLKEDLDSLDENTERKFCVKCNSCKNLVYEKSEFCNKCGKTIDKELFEEITLSKLGIIIEELIKNLGIEPILARSGNDFWTFHYNKLFYNIFIYESEYIYITSPICEVPNKNLDLFYSYIFSEKIIPYKVGISNDNNLIYFSYRNYLLDLFGPLQDKIKENIKIYFDKSLDFADYLIENFDIKLSNYTK